LTPDAELRRLRKQVANLEDDRRMLETRLAYAFREVSELCTRLFSGKRILQPAGPGLPASPLTKSRPPWVLWNELTDALSNAIRPMAAGRRKSL
jgi:hypothetical protein